MNLRLPEGSESSSRELDVPMKEAMRGRAWLCRRYALAQVEGRELHEVLQERVFLLGYAVELIQVQQTHLGELSFHLVGTREVHAVGVVGLQLWWQQGAAEGGLSESLFVADEQGRGAVCVQSVGESGPLRGQSEHPPVEGLCHPDMWDLSDEPRRQCARRVRPIPEAVGNTVGRDGIPLRLRNAPCVPRRGPNSRCRGGAPRGRWRSGLVPWRAGRSRFPYLICYGIPWLR